MLLYLSIIGVSAVIMTIISVLIGIEFLNALFFIVLGIIIEFGINAICAAAFHALPDKWFTKDKKIFKVGKKETKILNFFKVKKWKDSVWELGGLGGFSKDKVEDTSDEKYINQFIIEINKGVVIHFVSILASFSLLLFYNSIYMFSITLPIAVVSVLLNTMSLMVLRYNIPRLNIVLKRIERQKAKAFIQKTQDKNQENAENVS